MSKRYWYILLTYILMHASALIALPVMVSLLQMNLFEASLYWTFISFFIALIIILQLVRSGKEVRSTQDSVPFSHLILWTIIGVFMAYGAQILSLLIQMEVFGVKGGSENTQKIMQLIRQIPVFLIIPAIVAPILEEIVFRKVIFGSLYKRMNFFFAALISSFIFSIIHQELDHLLIYGAMGFVFAFVYVKTKRIIVPIIVHATMNSLTIAVQFSLTPEEIERLQKQLEEMMILIGI